MATPMFENSAVKKTGQLWKWTVSSALVILGAFAMFAGIVMPADDARTTFVLVIAGLMVAVIGLVLALATIRCPRCRTPWVWWAMKSQSAGTWLVWLMSRTHCPRCDDL